MEKIKCERCGHKWLKRQEKDPITCPKCKSPLWNVPRKQKQKQMIKDHSMKNE